MPTPSPVVRPLLPVEGGEVGVEALRGLEIAEVEVEGLAGVGRGVYSLMIVGFAAGLSLTSNSAESRDWVGLSLSFRVSRHVPGKSRFRGTTLKPVGEVA